MWFDNNWITSSKAGEHRRIGIPGGKRSAANDQADSTRDERIRLIERYIFLAKSSIPARGGGNGPHRFCGIGQRLDPTVERIGTTPTECLRIALPGDMHHAMRHFKVAIIEPQYYFKAKRNAHFRIDFAPTGHSRSSSQDQFRRFAYGIIDTEVFAREGGNFLPATFRYARLVQFKRFAQLCLERSLPLFSLPRCMKLGTGGIAKGAPVAAGLNRFNCGGE